PLRCPDPPVRAVKMAVEMRDGVAELAAGWRKHGHELGFGMGIAHGYATLGRIGFEGRFDYSAIGTVVNLAARLCSQAQAGQILVDPKVHAAIETLTEMSRLANWPSRASAAPSRPRHNRARAAGPPHPID